MSLLLTQDLNLVAQLNSIIDQMELQRHAYYPLTHHGKDGAKEICRIIGGIADNLPEDKKLSEEEKFTISCAALLCHIGLQAPDLRMLGQHIDKRGLSDSQQVLLWEKHALISYHIIRRDITDSEATGASIEFGLDKENPYIEPIALLVKYQDGPLEKGNYPISWPDIGSLRMELMSALFQFACQAAFDYRRIVWKRVYFQTTRETKITFWPYLYYRGLVFVDPLVLRPQFYIPRGVAELSAILQATVENKLRATYNSVMSTLVRYGLDLRLVEGKVEIMDGKDPWPMPEEVAFELRNKKVEWTEIAEFAEDKKIPDHKPDHYLTSILKPGNTLQRGRYEIQQVLSTPQSSNSYVYKAVDHILLDRPVVIKDPAFFTQQEILSQDDYKRLINRYHREVHILSDNPHPYMVQIYDLLEERFMIQEWVEGTSLRQIILDQKELPIADIIQLALEACDVMAYLGKTIGAIHRDIKPEHIFRRLNGHLCIIDFGIARASGLKTGYSSTQSIDGTWAYMAPEQFRGREDVRSDIFSLGVTLYEAIAFKLPYPRGAYAAEVYTSAVVPKPISLSEFRTSMPKELDLCLQKAIEINPDDRFTSWEDFQHELSSVLEKSKSNLPMFSEGISLRKSYQHTIFAVPDKLGEPLGTGFLLARHGTFWAVTCGHLMLNLGKTLRDEVRLEHFDSEVGFFTGLIAYLMYPDSMSPRFWSAKEDICIMKASLDFEWPKSLYLADVIPLPVHECFCFGYILSRQPRGAFIEHISVVNEAPRGFVELRQSRSSESSDPSIEEGASGTPLCDSAGKLLGIVQAAHGRNVAYLIPMKTILDLIDKISP
jgi:serine/threonine protein kinase